MVVMWKVEGIFCTYFVHRLSFVSAIMNVAVIFVMQVGSTHYFNVCSNSSIRFRYACFKDIWDRIESWEGSIEGFTKGYKYYGPQFNGDGSVTWREWAPGAYSIHLQGDFSTFLHL